MSFFLKSALKSGLIPDKIIKTYAHILPKFIKSAIQQTTQQLIS